MSEKKLEIISAIQRIIYSERNIEQTSQSGKRSKLTSSDENPFQLDEFQHFNKTVFKTLKKAKIKITSKFALILQK